MKHTEASDLALEALDSGQFRAALNRYGWRRAGGREGLYERYTNDLDPDSGLLVPLDSSRPDYEELMQDAVQALAQSDLRDANKVLRQLAPTPGDEVRFCKEISTVSGAIPWNLGDELYKSAGATLKASAKAAIDRKPSFGNTNHYIASEFLKSVLMGQTQVGSFVVTAYTPPEREFFEKESQKRELLLGSSGAHTGRDVVRIMRNVLTVTREALDEATRTERYGQFDEAVQYGLSREMAAALSGLVNQSDGAAVTIDWSRAVRVPDEEASDQEVLYEIREQTTTPELGRSEVEFKPTDRPILENVIKRLGAPMEVDQVTVTGTVEVLTRQVGKLGVIVLNVRSGSPASKMRVQLSIADYNAALEAHSKERVVRLAGRQERQGNYFWLREPSRMKMLGFASGQQGELEGL